MTESKGPSETTPVTVLCGGLGAGKTTLLSHLLDACDRDIAVVVNDVGAVNVDAELVEARTDLDTGGELVALEDGCICCSLGGALSRSVVALQREYDFEHLVIEASGVSEPEPIARQFVRGPAAGPYTLDAVVTVIDARTFHDAFAVADGEPVRRSPNESGHRPLAALWLEQIEFCDLLVLNKCDLVSERERERVTGLLETLQPRAELVATEFGTIDPDELLASELFDLEAAVASAGWKRAVEGGEGHGAGSTDHDQRSEVPDHDHSHDDRTHDHAGGDHTHPPERYGIEVTTYHRTRPFHPERFLTLLESLPSGLVRAKGLCWIAGRERQAITMSYAGTETSLEVTGRWIASLAPERQDAYRRAQEELYWNERWGDREIRLALIGRHCNFDEFEDRLDACLVTDGELDDDWSRFENPAPTAMGESVIRSSEDRQDGDGTGTESSVTGKHISPSAKDDGP